MAEFFRNKIRLVFWITGAVLFLLLAVYLVYALSFIGKKARGVFGADLMKSAEVVKFNIEKAEELIKR